MKQQVFTVIILFCALVLTLSSCASLTGFQDGRSIGKDNGEISLTLNMTQSPAFDEEVVDDILQALFFTNVEIGGRLGVSEKADLTMRLNSNLAWTIGTKVQVVGDRASKTALALGVEAGTFHLLSDLWNVQIPIYLSLHPTEKFAWYLNPRYIHQFEIVGSEIGLGYIGGNTGVMFGSRHKYGFDIGYYRVGELESGLSEVLFQIGLGVKFKFGNN